jgi:hypothetical protein
MDGSAIKDGVNVKGVENFVESSNMVGVIVGGDDVIDTRHFQRFQVRDDDGIALTAVAGVN